MSPVVVAPRASLFDVERLRELTRIATEDAETNDRESRFPTRTLGRLHEEGVYHAIFATDPAASNLELVRLIQAVSEGDPAAGLVLVNTIHAAHKFSLTDSWPAGLSDRFDELLAAGPVNLNSARAEPELGAPARGGLPKTVARRTAHGWAVSGRKAYVTGSRHLDYHSVWVRTDEDATRVGHVLVPARHPGIEVIETWDHLGLRGSATNDVVYTDVEVPLDHFTEIPYVDGRYVDPVGRGGPSSLFHVAIYVGVARAAQRAFADFAWGRVPSALGTPIAETERIRSIAGEIEGHLVQAEELLIGLTARADLGDPVAVERTRIAKPLIAESAIAAVLTASAALGNPALSRALPLERHLRDVLLARVHPPQLDLARVAVGRRELDRLRPVALLGKDLS
jgi:alkylation response protein AidB-like acyl-CoA dehydrogenase